MDSPRCHIIGTVWFHHHTWNLFRFRLIGSNISKFYTTDNPSFGLTLTIFNQSPMILHCPNLILYHSGPCQSPLGVLNLFNVYNWGRWTQIQSCIGNFDHLWTLLDQFWCLNNELWIWAKNKSWSTGLPQVSCNWHWLIWLSNLQLITV